MPLSLQAWTTRPFTQDLVNASLPARGSELLVPRAKAFIFDRSRDRFDSYAKTDKLARRRAISLNFA